MKKIKFIVFAHPEAHCEIPGDNFLQKDLHLSYGVGEKETAIGLQMNKAEKITVYDDSVDIFLFDDTGKLPQSGSNFFTTFCSKFYELKDKYEFKIVLHKGSDWDFNDIETGEGNFYAEYANEINWLRSLKENDNVIKQSHKSSEVFGKELKEIAIAIMLQDKDGYEAAIQDFNERFIDREFEKLLKPFASVDPFKADAALRAAKNALRDYVNELLAKP